MASFTLERGVAASPETVFDLLTDHRRYSEMTPLRRSELEREGDPAPNGVGAVRALHAVGPPIREEVIAYSRPGRFSYKVLSGLPVRDHVGTVSCLPEDGGTRIVYAIVTTPTLPVAGALVVAAVRKSVQGLLDGIAKEAERATV